MLAKGVCSLLLSVNAPVIVPQSGFSQSSTSFQVEVPRVAAGVAYVSGEFI